MPCKDVPFFSSYFHPLLEISLDEDAPGCLAGIKIHVLLWPPRCSPEVQRCQVPLPRWMDFAAPLAPAGWESCSPWLAAAPSSAALTPSSGRAVRGDGLWRFLMFDIRIGRENLHGSGALNGEALHGSAALCGETLDGRCPLQHVGLGDAGTGGRLTAGDSPARCQVLPPASPACYLQLGSEHLPKKEAASTGLAGELALPWGCLRIFVKKKKIGVDFDGFKMGSFETWIRWLHHPQGSSSMISIRQFWTIQVSKNMPW
jgi:hypothetical protein